MNINDFAEQFQNLDPDNVGNWPIVVRSVIVIVVCVAVGFAGYYFDTQHQQVELDKAVKKEESLKKDFEAKQKKASNLDAYKAQMKEMEDSFGTMLRQLPSKNEVAELLVDITQTGLANGLEFDMFKPNKELPKEFYAELPISIEVNGTYHALGEFASGVAALPRIVTIHNIVISAAKTGDDKLNMKATAKTYRYLDDEEIAAGLAAAKKSKKRRRKR